MKDVFYTELGIRIRNARISQLKTQQDVADRLGITRQNVSYYEKGERTIDVAIFIKLCDILNIEPNSLINEVRKYVYR